MLLDIIKEIQGVHSHEQICPLTNSSDEVLSANDSCPRAAKVRTNSDWEKERRDIFECCGIVGICDVGNEVWSPIPNVHLNEMLIKYSSCCCDHETQSVHTKV
jgi:hypothetical protein